LLSKIATEIGGVHIFSEHFQDYEPYLEKEFKNSVSSKRKYVDVEVDNDSNLGFAFTITEDGDVVNHNINEDCQVLISDSENEIFYFSKSPAGSSLHMNMLTESYRTINESLGDVVNDPFIEALYAAMFSFSRMGDYNMVSEILRATGDARLIKQKNNTFGTQKISELESEFLDAIKNPKLRFTEGYNPDLEPKVDAYCVLDMMEDLMSSFENKWYPNHEAFSYKRIGRKAVDKPKVSDAEKEELKQLITEGKFEELKEKTEEVSNKEDALKFEHLDKSAGHSISNQHRLTFL